MGAELVGRVGVVEGGAQGVVGEAQAAGGAVAAEEEVVFDDAGGPGFFPAERAGGGEVQVEAFQGEAVWWAEEVAGRGQADGLVGEGEAAA